MSDTAAPRVLAVTSTGASAAAVTPVLAALEAVGLTVRAIDAGRLGGDNDGAMERIFRAVVGEVSERRLQRELEANPPDVAIAFDAHVAMALAEARDLAARPAPVLAVVTELAPTESWAQAGADRYVVPDEETAVALADHGVEGGSIIVVGAVGEVAFALAAAEDRAELRKRFKITTPRAVLVEVGGLGYETAGQVALQLSLADASAKTTYLFDAGSDLEAATALRRQVPALDLKAKLFGDTEDVALLWRVADAIVARPRERAISRVMLLGSRLVAFLPEDGRAEALAKAVEARKIGVVAANALLLSSAIEPVVALSPRIPMPDGAANTADIAWVMGTEKRAIIDSRRNAAHAETRDRVRSAAAAASQAARVAAAPGDLEDLSGDAATATASVGPIPDNEEISRLRREVAARMAEVAKSIGEARSAAESWDTKSSVLAKSGDPDGAKKAARNADAERVRMHSGLREMHTLEQDLSKLEVAAKQAASVPRARPMPGVGDAGGGASNAGEASGSPRPRGPDVDELLARMKQEQKTAPSAKRSTRTSSGRPSSGRPPSPGSGRGDAIEDELAALKRKMSTKKKS